MTRVILISGAIDRCRCPMTAAAAALRIARVAASCVAIYVASCSTSASAVAASGGPEPQEQAPPAAEIPVPGEPAAADALRSQVSELVDTLDADQLARRQQAERDLIALGHAVLPLLPENDQRFSAEAQQRLRRIRLALEQQRAEAALDPRTVRLGTVATLAEALGAIREQTGIAVVAKEAAAAAPLTLTLGPLSFWESLDAVLDEAQLDIDFYSGAPGELALMPRSETRPSRTDSAAYAGVYRLETTSATARRDFHRPELNRLVIAVEVAWEPRLTPIGLHVPLDSITATLDDGTQLKPDAGQIDIAAQSQLPFSEISIPLPLPAGSPRRIATLSGTLSGLLPGAREEFKVPLHEASPPETVGNLTLWVEDVRANGELHEVRVEAAFADAGNAFESHRQWVFENPAYVVDANGERIDHLGYQVYRQTSDRVGVGYLFDLEGQLEGKTLHYETPISILQQDVAFELNDILLP